MTSTPNTDPKAPCHLCGLPVGKHPFLLVTAERTLAFCCDGCKGIHEMLHQINETPPPPPQNR